MMGAKNHAIVLPDANKEQTLQRPGRRRLRRGRPALHGRCRWWCWWARRRKWMPELVAKAKTPQGPRRHEPGTDVGPVVTCAAPSRVESLIERGIAKGADAGTGRPQAQVVTATREGNFVGPTIFSGVKPGMSVTTRKSLAPCCALSRPPTLDEAIAFMNANPNGNGTAIFTQSGAAARKFQEEIDVGQVGINVPIPVPVPLFSFTGSRASKLGDLGPYGKQVVMFYTQTKTVTARWFDDSTTSHGVNTTISLK